ncbi:MAG: hypothetical protein KatS3mg108_1433 [Isosphaeraceae bacterium]|nr:MAG: hypothetical protein KatS3mg108_1433 [Isosphaeraceae bacterium]
MHTRLGTVDVRSFRAWRLLPHPLLRSAAALVILTLAGATPGVAQPPLILVADQIRHWDQDQSRWVLLEGNAAALMDGRTTSLGPRALIRFRTIATEPQRLATVDAFGWDAQGLDAGSPLLSLRTTQAARLRARHPQDVSRLDAPPPDLAAAARTLSLAIPIITAHASRPPDPSPPPTDTPPPSEPDPANAPPLVGPSDPPGASPPSEPDSDDAPPLEGLAGAPSSPPPSDPALIPAQVPGDLGVPSFDLPQDPLIEDEGEPSLPPALDEPPTLPTPNATTPRSDALTAQDEEIFAPIAPETRRTWTLTPRYGGRPLQFDSFPAADGSTALVIRGGVILVSEVPGLGRVDLAADHVVLWTRDDPEGRGTRPQLGGPNSQDVNQPLEAYLEGDVVIRNDRLEQAGPADQTIFKADRAFYDFRTERLIALNAEANFFAPGLIAPIRTRAQLINQVRDTAVGPDGRLLLGPPRISADSTTTTGSRFPEPGYRFDAAAVDVTRIDEPLRDPATGGRLGGPAGLRPPSESTWLIDSRRNLYFLGPVPIFYWPRIRTTDDLDPPIRNLSFRYGNYFGYQVLTDWSVFKLLSIRKPAYIDNWNLDVDYLSFRGPALGSEIGWFGRDLLADLADPYNRRGAARDVDRPYFGYFDVWGILEHGNDVLGTGPAVVTYGPPGAGKAGFQRLDVPSFLDARGRFLARHMFEVLDRFQVDDDQSLRVQLEAGGYSDRHFLEQYYKWLFDSGLDQDTLAYLNYQNRNRALTLTGQVQFMDWITDTQFLPKLEYYRIGDTLLDQLFSYSQNWGIDYASVRTAAEVNNPNIFAFLPYDPISNTSGTWSSGRAWTTQQLELPINLGIIRLVPYGQGQLIGWTNQLNGDTTGRAWGAYGARVNLMAWKAFHNAESELLNVHGLAHKMTFDLDYRAAYSSLRLNTLGIQDQLDDDTYEFVRRYFALTNYVGGILPPQYDPRFLVLRRTLNPVVFAPDIQDTIQTFTLRMQQRLQTKRGPDGRRRIVDYMILDAQTTFFPNADRDNFGEPIGQTMYNYEWFLGDRTSFVSTGWFEFWEIDGNPILVTEPRKTNDPFGLNVITAGFSINRPPRGNVYLGYSIINTGPIATSALNAAFNYWLSPKWYGTAALSYDFGNAILLGTTFSVTRIGADFLTSVGLSVDPQRQNYTFGFELAPRFSPNVRLGSAVGTRFDSRFAPTQ